MSGKKLISLIVGLGNPGAKYEKTRHNAGFWLVDELARRFSAVPRTEAKFYGQVCRIGIAERDLRLLKPETYMNRSGQSLKAMSGFFKIPVSRILVVHDDIDLTPGRVKLKQGGGHGGHNGLRDITAQLGGGFWRLRLGVGHPGHRDQVIDYVLSRPGKGDQERILEAIDRAADVMGLLVSGEMEKAMHRLHSVTTPEI